MTTPQEAAEAVYKLPTEAGPGDVTHIYQLRTAFLNGVFWADGPISDDTVVKALSAYYDDHERAFSQSSVDAMRRALEASRG